MVEKRPPGPGGILRSTYALATDPLSFLDRVSRDHGDVVRFRVLDQTVYLFNHPDAIDELVIKNKDALSKDWLTREIGVVVGQGLLLSEGALWKKQRRLIQPGFHRDRIAQYADVMVAYAARAVADWRDGETRDFHVEMMRLTLDIVAKTLFGVEVGADGHDIEASLEVLADRFAGIDAVIPLPIPTPGNLRARRAIQGLDRVVYDIIAKRKQSGDTGDLVSMLLAASETMDDRQLRDEAITLILAGHETTAVALGWTFYLLARHPAVLTKLREEIDEVLGDRAATSDDVPKLRFADAVVRESMRLYPPAWAIGREALSDLEIAGFPIKKGSQLWAAQWVVHRDARWFPNPLTFDPSRWATATPAKHAYFPFGGGPRICIGNAFATMEMVLVLVTIARALDLTPTREVGMQASVTIRPKGGMPMKVARRSPPPPTHAS